MNIQNRYDRQIRFKAFGPQGQEKLGKAKVLLVGCGALGTHLADLLARAGVGHLRIVDRDIIEASNLQRQVLFDEEDARAKLPKAVVAEKKLKAVNSDIQIEGIVGDFNPGNCEELAEDADLLLDGTDNFETRYLINDFCVSEKKPWVYGACVGSYGMALPLLPDGGPCLRCVFDAPPPREQSPTCDTAGIIGPIASLVAAVQSAEAIKILCGLQASRKLLHIDLWTAEYRNINPGPANPQCVCCAKGNFEYLNAKRGTLVTTLCGRNAVQIFKKGADAVDFSALAVKLAGSGKASHNEFMFRFESGDWEITVFPDGRAIVKGSEDPDRAKAAYDRYIGG